MRLGETIALQWADVDVVEYEIRVERGFSAGQLEPPKSGHGRAHVAALDHNNVSKVFRRVLKESGLSTHFRPHCLRHTCASLLLQQGESPAFVQRQLGHASIKLTVDTYGNGSRSEAKRLLTGWIRESGLAPAG